MSFEKTTKLTFENQSCNNVSLPSAIKYFITNFYHDYESINIAAEDNNKLKNLGNKFYALALNIANIEIELPNKERISCEQLFRANSEEYGKMLDDIMDYIAIPTSERIEFSGEELLCLQNMIIN